MQLHLSSSADSLENSSSRSSKDAAMVGSGVPFQWEEAPGKPNISSSCNQMALQLPPKLQFQGHPSPSQRPCRPHPSPSRASPSHQKLKSLSKSMLKPASWSHPLPTQSWSSSPSPICEYAKPDKPSTNERFFFDKACPKEFNCSVSMDSWKPRHDVLVSSKALSFLAMEEHEAAAAAASPASSPWHPILFHGREGSASPCQPTPVKAAKELGGGDYDEEDDKGFHDCFSTTTSLEKPSQRTDESMEAASYSSASPWFLDFGPEEDEVHEEKGGSKLVVRLVALIKLKKVISSKVCKLRGRREGANQQANNTSMWSPTLATYLYNQKREEERESSSPSLDDLESDDDDDDDDELLSISSAASSYRFQINPDYHLPSSLFRGHLQPDNDFLEGVGFSSFRVHHLGLDESPCFSDEEEPHKFLELTRGACKYSDTNWNPQVEEETPRKLRHRLSLREQLSEFDDEYPPLQFLPTTQSTPLQILDSKKREPTPCKGMCKVQKTVKFLAAAIKLVLIQTDVGKRKGQQRSSLKYGSCLSVGTL